MELTLRLDNAVIDTIIRNLKLGREKRPVDAGAHITAYWKHHLSLINAEKVGDSNIRISGESGFYFPGMTYSGADLLNTLYKRFGLMKYIGGTQYDLSIPQPDNYPLGYTIKGKKTSSDFLRSTHHAYTILENMKKHDLEFSANPRFLEIGSGTGIQALVFKLLKPKSTYILVDFPETLMLAQVFLNMVMPEAKFLYFEDWDKNQDLLDGEYDFIFVPNYALSRVRSRSVELVLNTVSMQEMNYATIQNYFLEIRRILKAPALFYQCNRDKMMEGVLIELDKYPYLPSDRHLLRGIDQFYKRTIVMRKCFGRFPILRWIKIPIVRAGEQISHLTQMTQN